jgi:hypothetical protein
MVLIVELCLSPPDPSSAIDDHRRKGMLVGAEHSHRDLDPPAWREAAGGGGWPGSEGGRRRRNRGGAAAARNSMDVCELPVIVFAEVIGPFQVMSSSSPRGASSAQRRSSTAMES